MRKKEKVATAYAQASKQKIMKKKNECYSKTNTTKKNKAPAAYALSNFFVYVGLPNF